MKQDLPYQRIIFICVNEREVGKCCSGAGQDIRAQLKEYVKQKGLKGKVRISASGCMDKCAQGPNVMIFPDNVWYRNVDAKDLEEIKKIYVDSLNEPAVQ